MLQDLFTVSISKCNETIATYTGGYNSTIIFHYNSQTDEWSVLYWENLWDNEKHCDACGDAVACKPKSKKSKKKAKKPSSSVMKPIHSSDDDDKNTTSTTKKKSSKSKPRYGPAAVNLRVTMFDDGDWSWWKRDYLGASWYLADDRRTTLFQTGSLCDASGSKRKSGKDGSEVKFSGYCNLCLGDGTYSMRFSGQPSNDFTAWDFCGVQGGQGQELTFHVKKGKCIADSLLGVEASCYGTVVSTVSVRGIVNLFGLTSEFIESSQYSIMPSILADAVVGWDSGNIEVQSTTLTSRSLSSTSRSLAEFDVDVEFTASFQSESDYGVEGRLFSKVQSLVASLEDSLASKVSSESFTLSLSQSALLAGAVSLERVQSAELVSLELESISFEGVQEMKASTLPAFDDTEYWGSSKLNISSYNFESIAMFVVATCAGFIAIVGLVSHSVHGYHRVSHTMDETRDDILPSEMDTTVSNAVNTSKDYLRTEIATSL